VATVSALQSFVGRLSKDTKEPDTKLDGKVVAGRVTPGKSVQVRQGQNFEDNHPVVKAFPSMFGAVDSLHPVEQATAAPGEKRGR
jgi:hypothetical protein